MPNIDLEHFLVKLIHDKRVPLACSAVLLLILLGSLLSFLSIFNDSASQNTILNPSQAKIKKLEISQYHLFGQFQGRTASIEAPLNLSLQAIFFVESSPKNSSALISENGEEARLYYVNDDLSNGAKIQEIAMDRIFLNLNGVSQVLILPIPKLEFAPPPQDTLPISSSSS